MFMVLRDGVALFKTPFMTRQKACDEALLRSRIDNDGDERDVVYTVMPCDNEGKVKRNSKPVARYSVLSIH